MHMRNVQRPADGRAEAALAIAGLALRLAIQRIRFGVEPGSAIVEKDGTVRLVYVEPAQAASAATAAHHHNHGPAGSAKTASATKTSTAAHHLDIGRSSAQRDGA